MEVVGQFNPYKCEGFPRDVTPFHYSGTELYDHHVKQAVSFASLPTVLPSVCLSVCLFFLWWSMYIYSLFNIQYSMTGTALGGWMVLEPWITPSLFYQFLGRTAKYKKDTPTKIGMDR